MKLLLVVAWISVDLAVLDWTLEQGIVWPQPVAACLLGAVLGQAALVAIWGVWSSANSALRVALATLGLFALAWLASSVVAERAAQDQWFMLLLIQATLLAAICHADAMLNPQSLRGIFRADAPARKRGARARPCQFSLAGLVTLTTASALALGTLQWAALPAKPLPMVTSFCCLSAVNCFVTLRLLPHQRWLVALVGILLIGIVLGGLMGRTGLPPCAPEMLILTTCAQAATVAASLAVLQISG